MVDKCNYLLQFFKIEVAIKITPRQQQDIYKPELEVAKMLLEQRFPNFGTWLVVLEK